MRLAERQAQLLRRAVTHPPLGERVRPRREEAEAQERFIEWIREAEASCPRLCLLFHPPNGGKRGRKVAAEMHRLGTRRGVPDIMLPARRGDAPGLAIEFKSNTGRLSKDQVSYRVLLEDEGWAYEVHTDWRAAACSVSAWVGIPAPPERGESV